MDDARRSVLEPLYTSLEPHEYGLLPFPSKSDDGDGDGSDNDLAQIIYYGSHTDDMEKAVEFAIRLGRALEKSKC
jgi:hypothetical protein